MKTEQHGAGDRQRAGKELFPGAAAALLAWYDARKRDLPWRRTSDPYRIWLSEIMLQQTRVATVIPYYETFVARFPDVRALASAEIDEVLALWSGLGYYRRARQLHAAAQQVVAEGGTLPTTAAELSNLPGIGSYTSAAIASIAFGEVVPVMDGNVERVTSRLLARAEDPKRKAHRIPLVECALGLLDPARPGDGNQALMELGATVCRPTNPACLTCPLAEGCRGRGQPEAYPAPRRRRAVEKVRLAVVLVRRPPKELLFFRRDHADELMAGLWELPNCPLVPAGDTERPPRTKSRARTEDRPARDCARETAAAELELGRRYGGRWTIEPTGVVAKHGITHRALALEIFHGEQTFAGSELDDSVLEEGPAAAWIGPGEHSRYAMSSMVGKVLSELEKSCESAERSKKAPTGPALSSPGGSGGRQAEGAAGAGGIEDVPADQLVIDFPQALGDQSAE